MVGSVASNFTDLVMVGERIELGIRRWKLTQANSNVGFAKKLLPEKKKGEANVVLIELVFSQGKGTTPSYPVQFHVGAGSTVAHSPPIFIEAGRLVDSPISHLNCESRAPNGKLGTYIPNPGGRLRESPTILKPSPYTHSPIHILRGGRQTESLTLSFATRSPPELR
ncbi:hypothetical protein CR513_40529, partial [Mucuna pruriens]